MSFTVLNKAPTLATIRSSGTVSCSYRHAAPQLTAAHRRRNQHIVRAEAAPVIKVSTPPPAITLSDRALIHLRKLKDESESGDQLVLRMGVRSGGCSGMSYFMDFEAGTNVKPEDAIIEYDNGDFKLVCDPKSLLYLFGMELDYSSELIGGGLIFKNPNAESSCGCGKSFGV